MSAASYAAGGYVTWDSYYRQQSGCSLKVKYKVSLRPTNFTSRYIPRELKSYIHTRTCTWMFLTLFIREPKNGNNLTVYQLMNVYKQNMIYRYNGILFS